MNNRNSGWNIISWNGTNNLAFNWASTNGSIWQDQGTNFFTFTNNGKLGINTSPSANLDVVGNMRLTNDLRFTNTGDMKGLVWGGNTWASYFSRIDDYNGQLNILTDDNLYFGGIDQNTGLPTVDKTMYMNMGNKRVGINNTSPASTLDVSGNVKITNQPSSATSTNAIIVDPINPNPATQALQVFGNSSGNDGITVENLGTGNPQLRFLNAGAEKAAITLAKGSPNNTVYHFIDGNNIMAITKDNVQINPNTGSAMYMQGGRYSTGTGFTNSEGAFSFDLPGTGIVSFSDNVVFNGGNVGINKGSAMPTAKLDIVGNIKMTNNGANSFQLLSGASTNNTSLGIGRTATDLEFGVAVNNGNFASNAVAGDVIIRQNNSSNKLLFNVGSGASTLALTNNSVILTGSLTTSGTLTAGSITTAGSLTVGSINTSGSLTASNLTASGTLTVGTMVLSGINDNLTLGRSINYSSTTGISNTSVGSNAGKNITSGYHNDNFGAFAGPSITTGYQNNNFGGASGYYITTGYQNNNYGYSAGNENVSGFLNSNFGHQAGKSLTGNGNVTLGANAGMANANLNYSVLIGYNAGYDADASTSDIKSTKPFFMVNNSASNENPLLFGYFVDTDDYNSTADPNASRYGTGSIRMAQLGINTHELVDSCALTVGGAVHIGPKDNDANTSFSAANTKYYKDYLLWVEKGIVSEDYAIVPKADWADAPADGDGSIIQMSEDRWGDFVFGDNYDLISLKELEEFINKNKHLPGIPSAEEIVKQGYSLSKMNKNFIVKIEELTLYTIEQDKKIKALELQLTQYESLAKEVEALKKQMKGKKK
ncbi:MAG: hypothetical protein NW226_08450 [Microscillaceae bacterium]|nr:hypothetical protein [Microscillaceae bacterium]